MRIFCTDKLAMGYGEEMYPVDLYTKSTEKLRKDTLYIHESYVYKYMGKIDKYTEELKLEPGVYKIDKGFVFIEPYNDIQRKAMTINNVVELDPIAILAEIESNKNDFVNADDLEIISNNAEIFVPIINPDDDFLKKLVKRAIIEKKINLSNYKDRSSNKWTLTNLKSGLNKKSPVSIKAFKLWCEILGLDFDINVYDNGIDKKAPLKEPITMNKDEI